MGARGYEGARGCGGVGAALARGAGTLGARCRNPGTSDHRGEPALTSACRGLGVLQVGVVLPPVVIMLDDGDVVRGALDEDARGAATWAPQ